MNKIRIIFFLLTTLFCAPCESQIAPYAIVPTTIINQSEQFLGYVYNQTTWPDYSNWTAVGITPTVSGGKLNLNGTCTFTKYIYNNYGTTNLSDFEITWTQETGTLSAAVNSVIGGTITDGAYSGNDIQAAVVVTSTASTKGRLTIYHNNSAVVNSTDAGKSGQLPMSSSETLQCVFIRHGWHYSFTVTNLTTPDQRTIEYDVDPTLLTSIIQTTGKFVLYACGNTNIPSTSCYSSAYASPNVVFVGDSKVEGVGVSTLANSFPVLTFVGRNRRFVVLAKANNLTQDIINALHEATSLHPKYIIIEGGGNDLRSGVADATWQANLSSIRATIVANGIIPIWLEYPPETTYSNQIKTYVQATFPSDYYVSLTGYNTATMNSGIHPNTVGTAFISNAIITQVPFIFN